MRESDIADASEVVPHGPLTSAHEAILPLIRLIQGAGISDAAIERNTGLDLSRIEDPNLRVRLSVMDWLWDTAADVRDDPAIGLHLIELYPGNHMHFVAQLAMRADTIGAAILQWRDYARLVCDADEITFALDRDSAVLGYRLLDPRFESRHLAEHYLSMAVFYGRQFCGEHLTARRVNFRHRDAGYRKELETYFGAPVYFEQADNEILFDPAIVAMPNVTADPYMKSILEKQATLMAAEAKVDDPVYRVRRWLSAALARGHKINLADAASDLATSERSLSRALKDSGTSFRELTDGLRRTLAEQYLEDGLSVTQTAYFLGFSEPGALHHAFSRWHEGTSIREWLTQKAEP